jgi:PhoPQ-activated pathogenicity-related protein
MNPMQQNQPTDPLDPMNNNPSGKSRLMCRIVTRYFLIPAALFLGHVASVQASALDDYIAKPDSSFQWKVAAREDMNGLDVTTIDLTSQTWRGGTWTHKLYIGRPHEIRNPGIVLLRIAAGADKNAVPTAKFLAEHSGAMVAILTDVPNQPLFGGKKEDQIIAYTFDQFARTGDETWPALLPMTKSAVRAMDAIQAWAQSEKLPPVEKFVVTGASKRGWTTWLTGAMDSRVAGIAPMVFDMLNMSAQCDWQKKVYGHPSEQIHNYTDLGLVDEMDKPDGAKLRAIVDPYSYAKLLHMPKLVILGTNDRYWTVDSPRHYWQQLPEPKLLFEAPGTGHKAGDTPGAIYALAAFFQMIADHQNLPGLEWQMNGNDSGSISASCDRPAKQARLWTAFSPTRDFRDAKWTSQPLDMTSGNTKAAAAEKKPETGYSAMMIQVTFTAFSGEDYSLSTQVQVIPDNPG